MSDYCQIGFYRSEGALPPNQPSYVLRRADDELYRNLAEGQLCYVLTSRQVGKSSLMVRTASRLRAEGFSVATVDLTSVGKNLTLSQWYFGLLDRIGEDLELEEKLEEFWNNHRDLGPMQRWSKALREVVLAEIKGAVVIFFDEIDLVQSLEFDTDEFFGSIRQLSMRRAQDSELSRLTFCFLGVATPSDLVKNPVIAPFNVGKRIELDDFTEEEALRLAEGLGPSKAGERLIKRIFHWTAGHPYLTQTLCEAVACDDGVTGPRGIDRLCGERFLSYRAREKDNNLREVDRRMLGSGGDIAALLHTYNEVRTRGRVRADDTNPLVAVIRLSGVARPIDGILRVRNRIYWKVFDNNWVTTNMPDAELRRQRAYYRKGKIRASAIWAIFAVLLAAMALAFNKVSQSRMIAEDELRKAETAKTTALAAVKDQERETELARLRGREAELKQWIRAESETKRADRVLWQMIKDDPNPVTFKAYREVYAGGPFEKQAIRKMRITVPADLQLNGVIIGRVADAGGGPIAGAAVTARKQDVEKEMVTNDQGKFMIPMLPPGTYTVSFSAEGYQPKTVTAAVTPEKVCRIRDRDGVLRKPQ